MQPKILLVSNDPALRLRMQIGLEGAEIRFARDEYEARRVLDAMGREDASTASQPPQEGPWTRPGEILPFEEYERRILQHALTTTGWNVKQAAARLGIGRATLYRKIDRYDLRGRNAG
jgi:transcriptional regulator of acetoin/glycerol metabolism